jgi:hypothetical protein
MLGLGFVESMSKLNTKTSNIMLGLGFVSSMRKLNTMPN